MKLIRKIIGVACLFAGFANCSFGQNSGQDVVVVPLVNARAITMTTVFTSGVLQNIGQTSHEIHVQVSGSSSIYFVTGAMQGSIDGTNWFNIGLPVNTDGEIDQTFRILGFRPHPYLRSTVTINPGMNASLTVTLDYIGTSSPSFNLTDSLSRDLNMQSDVAIVTNGSGAQTLAPPAGQSIAIYSMTIDTATTLTEALIYCTVTSGTVTVFQLANFTVARTVVLPIGTRPYFSCFPGESFGWLFTGTGTTGFNFSYRFE